MQKIIFCLLLFMPAIANADLNCQAQLSNRVGDQIQGVYTFTGFQNSDTSLRFQVLAEPGDVDPFDPPSQVATDSHRYYTIGFTATWPDMVIRSQQFAGSHAWACEIDVTVFPVPIVMPVLQSTKRNAQNWSNFFSFMRGVSIGAGGTLSLSGYKGSGWIIGTIGGLYFSEKKDEQDKIVTDPWDDNYNVPYDPVWRDPSELGYTCDGAVDDFGDGMWPWLCPGLIDSAAQLAMYADMAYVSANRANSCTQAGVDCAGWQADRVHWALRQYGAWLSTWNWFLAVIGGELIDYGVNAVDPDSGWDIIGGLGVAQGAISEASQDYGSY